MDSDNLVYENHGIRLSIPAGWAVTEQIGEDGDITISVEDGDAFWALTLLRDRPRIEQVLTEAQSAFADEYKDVDATELSTTLSNFAGVGLDLNFICLELINTAAMRCVRTGRFTAFVMYQMTDHEREYYKPIFEEITASLDLERDQDVIIS